MALVKNSESERLVRDAIVLDLGDLRRQGEELIARAKAEADRVVREAQAERQKLIAGAAEEGRAKGHAEGLAKGRQEGLEKGRQEGLAQSKQAIDAVVKGWTSALEDFEKRREALLQSARRDAVALAVSVAERVVRRKIEADPSVVEAQMEAALALAMRATRLSIRTHPDDLARAHEAMPALLQRLAPGAHAEALADESIGRGSCVIDTELGAIDASVRTQLDRIADAILPGARGRLESLTDVPPPDGEAGA